MRKKLILLVFLSVSAGVLFYLFKDVIFDKVLLLTSKGGQDRVNDISAKKSYTKEDRLKDINLVNMANNEKKVAYCAKITESYTRDLCYNQAAKRDLNENICSDILNDNTKTMCSYFVFVELAVNNKDVNICQKLQHNNLVDNCVKAYEKKIKCNNESCLDSD